MCLKDRRRSRYLMFQNYTTSSLRVFPVRLEGLAILPCVIDDSLDNATEPFGLQRNVGACFSDPTCIQICKCFTHLPAQLRPRVKLQL